jgi:hypothetical protein
MNIKTLTAFPLLILSVIYFYLRSIWADGPQWTNDQAFTLSTMTAQPISLTSGEIFIMISLILLFLEILKSARSMTSHLANNMLSILTLIIAVGLMFSSPLCASPSFVTLTMIIVIDVMAAAYVTPVAAKRDLDVVS